MLWAVHGLWWYVGRRAPNSQPRILLDVVANAVHNAALFVIMAEACLIYSTAGWYKIQGSRWQDGTAVYYPLHLDYFTPWPALSDLMSSYGVIVLLVTYGTVAVQVAFPFTLLNRRAKNVLLAAMMTEHAVIAVVLGLPFFSLAMIAADAVFLPTSFLSRVGAEAARVRGRFVRGGLARLALPGPRKEAPPTAEESHARRLGVSRASTLLGRGAPVRAVLPRRTARAARWDPTARTPRKGSAHRAAREGRTAQAPRTDRTQRAARGAATLGSSGPATRAAQSRRPAGRP